MGTGGTCVAFTVAPCKLPRRSARCSSWKRAFPPRSRHSATRSDVRERTSLRLPLARVEDAVTFQHRGDGLNVDAPDDTVEDTEVDGLLQDALGRLDRLRVP